MLFSPIQSPQPVERFSLTKYTALFGMALRLIDVIAIGVGAVAAHWCVFGTMLVSVECRQVVVRGLLSALLVIAVSTRSWFKYRQLMVDIGRSTATWVVVFALNAICVAAFDIHGMSSVAWWATWMALTVAVSGAARVACQLIALWVRGHGLDVRSAVVVGNSAEAATIVGTLQRERSAGIMVDGWFGSAEGRWHAGLAGVPYLGGVDALAAHVEMRSINQVWIALPDGEQEAVDSVLDALVHSTAEIKFVPGVSRLGLLNHSVEQVSGLPVINLRAGPLTAEARVVKAIEDRIVAVAILVLIAPLLVLIAIGVKMSSPGPVLFKQRRHGIDGRTISVWKFRSMRPHREADGAVTQASKNDPRVTPFGRFLRRTSLDELPQFFNVLQGSMSIVGPRPHAVEHNHHYKELVHNYMQRHRVKPGITGWAQINGLRGETDTVEKMVARVEHDLYYMQHWSLLLDLRIIVMTMFKGFVGSKAY